MPDQSDLWKEKLKDVDFERARNEIAYVFKIAKEDAEGQGGEYYIKPEFNDVLTPFMSKPCLENAIKLLECWPDAYPYFEQSKSGLFVHDMKKSFVEGVESSKFTTRRQAIIRGSIHGIIIAISIFNPFKILVKAIILIVLLLLFGAIASSKRFRGKL